MPSERISGEKRIEVINRPLIPVFFFFISGIIAGRILLSSIQGIYLPLVLLIVCLLVVSFIPRSRSFRLICFLSIFFLTGIFLFISASKQPSILTELAETKSSAILEGTVLNQESLYQERSRLDVSVEAVYLNSNVIYLREKAAVTVYKNMIDLEVGQRIRFPASLSLFKNFNNPGRYDYEDAMAMKGFSCRASVSDGRYIIRVGRGDLNFIMKAMEAARGPVRKLIMNNLSPINQAVYRALILGEMQGIDNDLRESFNITGLGHILSVSGMHVALVAVTSFSLFRFLFSLSYGLMLRIDIRKLTALITCLCVFAYTFIAGFQVSAKRAMIMAITYLLSMVIGREKDSWSTLALAAVIVLALDPNDLFNISFQLSFIAVIGIFWLSPEIYRLSKAVLYDDHIENILSRVYVYFSSLLVITLSAVIFLLPVTTYYFNRVSVIAVPINLIVEPLLGLWILPVGLLSVVFLPVSSSLSSIILKLGALGLDCMMNIIRFWSGFPWASFLSIRPNPFEVILCYSIIIFLVFTIKKRSWAKWGLLFILVISAIDASYWIYETRFNRDIRVTFIDVGQGNSALVQLPGRERMLIDGGGFTSGSYDTGKMVVAPFLLYLKIRRIDYIVLSHPHPDHLNGLNFIAEYFNPKEFWYNGQDVETPEFLELIKTVKKKGIGVLLPDDLSSGRVIEGVKIELCHPPVAEESWSAYVSEDDKGLNNNSMVLRISYRGKSFIFPGDIESQGERNVVKNCGYNLDSDVLLAPHHGSKTSSTVPFLDAVTPEISVISCGKGNSFGFPHAEAIKRLKDTGSEIIGIHESGAVRISVKEDGLRIKKFVETN
ncbi:MAG: DNA internalization-related competence protein ComEC/Rec2 [Deltaproteobacteria bacterium]|nr:DNA internalization-related competence protein ComEC/Rec2 [Deltaproteobacteria bacterium]